MTTGAQNYGIFKGMLDAKNDQGQPVYLLFCAVSGSSDPLLLEVAGSAEPLDPALPWKTFLEEVRSRGQEGNSFYAYAASQVEAFLRDQNLLPQTVKHGNLKTLEQALCRFLGDRLALKAVGMVKSEEPAEEDLSVLLEEVRARKEAQRRDPAEEAGDGSAPAAAPASREPHLVVLACQPLMDPVNGVPLSGLTVGDEVLASLPQDSFFFELFRNRVPGFDGVVTARVTGIKALETGSAQVDLYLSEGILGSLKLSGNVRVRVPHREAPEGPKSAPGPGPLVFLGVLGVLVLGAALFFLLR